jgi:hypothetical protein
MMATIANMVTERMSIKIDTGSVINGNEAPAGRTWCDVLDSPDEDTPGADWINFKPISFLESVELE